MLKILPLISHEEVFALKGGTANNFFWRDFPRLSVDIDLVYVPVPERSITFNQISDSMLSIETRIKNIIPGVEIQRMLSSEYRTITKLIARTKNATVKIEPNTVIRGTVFPVVKRTLCDKAEAMFEVSMDIRSLSLEDLYGGKICAALDRQHPRDLFDIKLLLKNEGFTEGIRKAFIVYLVSHDRPMIELLEPGRLNIEKIFETEFKGMETEEEVALSDLITAREMLIGLFKTSLTEDEKKFLLSFKGKQPDWTLLGLEGMQKLPAVKWKLHNLNKMQSEKHNKAYLKLEKYLLT